MEPVEDGRHGCLCRRAHQRRQRGIAVADRGNNVAVPPALVQQRRPQQRMGPLGHAAHQGKAPGIAACTPDFAADRLEA